MVGAGPGKPPDAELLPQSPLATRITLADAGAIDASRRPARTSDAIGKRAPASSNRQQAEATAAMIQGNLRMEPPALREAVSPTTARGGTRSSLFSGPSVLARRERRDTGAETCGARWPRPRQAESTTETCIFPR